MEPMTPDERLTKIENLLHSLTESQVQFQIEMQQMKDKSALHDAEIEKQNAGIRDLIIASRAFLESQKEVTGQILEMRKADDALRERLDETASRLNALIAEVDRIIRKDKQQ
jgi:hypothetical protein